MQLSMMFLFLIVGLIRAADPDVPFYVSVGNVDIWRIQDNFRTVALTSVFRLTPADFNGMVDSNGKPYLADNGDFAEPMSYSGTLLRSQGKWILVDDGQGSLVPSNQPNRIPDLIQKLDVALTDINFVLLTHFHQDHTGWNVHAPQNTVEFPNAKYIAQSDEINYWSSTPALRNQSNFQNVIQPIVSAGILVPVTGVNYITDEVSVIPCKGHTPGHQCIEIHSEGSSGIIVGDSMHRSVQVQRPDWSAVFDWDTTLSEPLRVSMVSRLGENNFLTVASHFAYPGVGHVLREQNPLPTSSGWIFVPME